MFEKRYAELQELQKAREREAQRYEQNLLGNRIFFLRMRLVSEITGALVRLIGLKFDLFSLQEA